VLGAFAVGLGIRLPDLRGMIEDSVFVLSHGLCDLRRFYVTGPRGAFSCGMSP
jgi:hypothetical protein